LSLDDNNVQWQNTMTTTHNNARESAMSTQVDDAMCDKTHRDDRPIRRRHGTTTYRRTTTYDNACQCTTTT